MKLLIELPTWLGDCVMATPAIENIVNFYNDAEITFIGSFVSIEAMKNHPKVVKTVFFDKKYSSLYKTAKKLGGFDVFFSFRSSTRSKFLKFLISANNKYQFDKNKYINCHQVEKYNDFVNDSLNLDSNPGKLKLYKQNHSSKVVRKSTLGINPGASYGSAKRWYPEEFAKVASGLASQYDIIIFGGPGEQDIALDIEQSFIEEGVNNYQNLVGKTTIPELIDHISKLDLFITGDSGPMHVAAAFQVPTVAIFGPTKDDETSQWMNEKSIIVKKHLDCQPCMKRACPLGHHNCMSFIKAIDVLDAVKRLS
ncbi:MAG: lipopolysaccharide heptosyltransferase II [Proteobacteria bacterium]|nr:lipopolysaccharide heptosyltransferase II [Pseudomonadota bacterium]MCH9711363.1 lipopolysaccharide heptosyltransferase II [Pseudomonadota bacterium]MCH9749332.1 lipopolysaccharide heptosyltransferase II [Pseudomonadota bacterium]